ncbi:ankyrin repeat domain-containing protein [Arcobacter roscoffensis]|uniref:Ankyrin repeat domain-containing protein n=1 Tax=Arcobacter roscoffensis TaxID=2961520 RepID=A0ABY5E711_9BACT|nr:ankyrin repeat domain-containing protein [Arcobacter roscoffensis]UTJ06928.1 ankyrin repeat domain-containing protein [Arcobacter roscoffensis]
MKKTLLVIVAIFLFLTGCSFSQNSSNIKIENKVDELQDFIGETPLHDAVRAKDINQVRKLLKSNIEVNLKDKYGYTALHLSARLDELEIAKFLVKNGATVNSIDIFKDTPLLDSTRNSTNTMSKFLICNGAKKSVKDRHSMTPLHNTSKNSDIFIMKMIQTNDISKMCENLDITLDYYSADENKICGSIIKGVATKVKLTIVNENVENTEPFGTYESKIADSKYCAFLDKTLDMSESYLITAIGTNTVDKDIEIANLADLIKEEEPLVEEVPTKFISGLYEDLMEEFKDDFEPWNAKLEKDGLIFRFMKPSVLFTKGSSDLKESYKNILDDFFPRYLKVLNKYKNEIAEVRVEGHTSSEYSSVKTLEQKYMKNKILSQKRAKQVLDYTLNMQEKKVLENKEWLDTLYNSYGMSSDNLILDENGIEDKNASRRVEFNIEKIME